MKKLGIAGLALTGILATSGAASAQVCGIGIIVAAIHASTTENRELTSKEAMTCGLVREAAAPKAKKKAAKPAKKPG